LSTGIYKGRLKEVEDRKKKGEDESPPLAF
jgi:hypothetical protein